MENFKDYAIYYDLLYGDKDYKSETDYVVALLSDQGINAGRVLEMGCG